MSSPRQNRFQSFTPLRSGSQSLRRLKTAFSPVRSIRSISPSSAFSTSSTETTSPLTRTASPSNFSSPSSHRSTSSTHSIRQLLAVRRKPSVLDLELEEERLIFGGDMAPSHQVLEPRTMGRTEVEVGIFEVLDGKF